MASELDIDIRTEPEAVIVAFRGSLDATNLGIAEERVSEQLDAMQLMQNGPRKLIFDFSALEYLNSKAVGFLASFSQRVALANCQFIIAGVKPNVEDILTVVGLNQIVPVLKTVEEGKDL